MAGDLSEFEREMSDVDKLESTPRIDRTAGPKELTPQQMAAQKHATEEPSPNYMRDFLDEGSQVMPDHVFQWHREGTQVAVLDRLKLGHYASGDQIDLHHKSIQEAHGLIWSFLSDALDNGHRNVRIIHGKGARSNPPARLKSYVGQVLKEHNDVFAFCTAPAELGGAGTTLVWLRKSEEEKEATRERIMSRRG